MFGQSTTMSAVRRASSSGGFYGSHDGWLYCDEIKLSELHRQLMTSGIFPASPAFVYSRRLLEDNVKQWQAALDMLPVPSKLNYSMKANHNLQILGILRSMGCGLTLVSGGELQIALSAGFEPSRLVLNGSCKVRWEVEAAVRADVLLNVDSEFDLEQLVDVCTQLGRPARALLRLNLDIDPHVHKYLSTGKSGSKFGLDAAANARVVKVLISNNCPVRVEGLHCHLGSTIRDASVFRESVRRLLAIRQELTSQGLQGLHTVNIGGGLNIDYTRQQDETKPYRAEDEDVHHDLARLSEDLQQAAAEEPEERHLVAMSALATVHDYCKERIARATLDQKLKETMEQLWPKHDPREAYPALFREKENVPTPKELIENIVGLFETPRDDDLTIIAEPGRTIVGDAGVLLTTVCGIKSSGTSEFLVVDGSMTDVIRPTLYGAYHHIHPAAPLTLTHAHPPTAEKDTEQSSGQGRGQGDLRVMDVVGPVCESGDFLGKDRLLPMLPSGACVVVRDVGAYCASMASNYNVRMRPMEVLVDGSSWRLIRRPDTVDDIMRPYQVD